MAEEVCEMHMDSCVRGYHSFWNAVVGAMPTGTYKHWTATQSLSCHLEE